MELGLVAALPLKAPIPDYIIYYTCFIYYGNNGGHVSPSSSHAIAVSSLVVRKFVRKLGHKRDCKHGFRGGSSRGHA